MADNVICGVTNFEVKRVLRKAADGKDIFFQTHDGYWVTGDPELVEFVPEQKKLEKAEAEKILEKALKDSESYDYGYQTVIIAGDRYEYGSDEDEIIVENAEVIGIV